MIYIYIYHNYMYVRITIAIQFLRYIMSNDYSDPFNILTIIN